MLSALILATALAGPSDSDDFECDGSEEFCARLEKALELGEQLESVVEPEAFEGVEAVHYREVTARKPLKARRPVQADVMFRDPVRCAFRVFIDEKGYAYDLRFLNCPEVFHRNVAEALPSARWEPFRLEGKRVKATFATHLML